MRLFLAVPFLLAGCATVPRAPSPEERAQRWWGDVSALADDGMEGRLTGTPGYQRAADYVVSRLQAMGLEPAGTDGFFQPIAFEEQVVDHAASRAALIGPGGTTVLSLPQDMIVGRGDGRRPARIEAPLVFVGYGLHIPEAGHDDFAGLDLAGRIAVVISGGPAHISAALKAHARRDRARLLAERGALGMITLTAPKAVETPWSRSVAQAGQSGMYFADPALRDVKSEFFNASVATEASETLFAGSGHSFAEVAALADASGPLPRVALARTLRAQVVTRHKAVRASNVVARLPGSDPALRDEHVVFSGHLDHLGVGAPINGDGLYNGAMDNGAGIASLLDIAQSIVERRARPKRSLLFVFVTAEEKGLLGSRYFSLRPSVPRRSIVADLNFDMALPIFPLRSVIALGAEESSLGTVAAEVGAGMGLPLVPDPWPDRNSFVRSDQYSFIREGIPALAFKFGFARGTPEAEIERVWRSTRYHAPSDDLSQPVEKIDAVRLNDFVAAIGLKVANASERPRWNDQSFFRRFAKD
ncbi:M28 family peptidase [Sphingomonas parva]|uniref:M28 family peptidase n=1 Tax=Sphingomonas parva TaxID=2555898 RepID=A0A4Y8ZLN2_9SPHN|nr:M28 family metallopeptidase [Sphingomonas parva]TFI56918.1 M28 family peptidase [Sphingomonas parva]